MSILFMYTVQVTAENDFILFLCFLRLGVSFLLGSYLCVAHVCGRLGSLPRPSFLPCKVSPGDPFSCWCFHPLMLFKFLTMSYSLSFARLAEEKKEEGNQLYKLKSYRDALAKYSEAIGRFFLHQIRIGTGHWLVHWTPSCTLLL